MLAYLLVAVESGNDKKVMNKLLEMKEVEEAHLLFGEWDIVAKVKVENVQELSTFVVEKVRKLAVVRLTSTMIVAE